MVQQDVPVELYMCLMAMHGDLILGCADGLLRIYRHDALCDLLWRTLVQDHSDGEKEQCCMCC